MPRNDEPLEATKQELKLADYRLQRVPERCERRKCCTSACTESDSAEYTLTPSALRDI
jgi:hypothetical protein